MLFSSEKGRRQRRMKKEVERKKKRGDNSNQIKDKANTIKSEKLKRREV